MTDSYAVFGNPIAHSLSPQIHQAFARQCGQDLSYERRLIEPGQFSCAAAAFFDAGGLGLNITLPFKVDAYSFADQLGRSARQAGAVNTLARQHDGTVLGDNTDGIGLLRDMQDNLQWSVSGQRVLLLGAGGAMRGALGPLLSAGPAQVVVANRTADKALQLATAFAGSGELFGCGYDKLPGRQFDLVINGTSASLAGDMPQLPEHLLAPGAVCYDMMYAPEATVFMRWAQAQGARACSDGLGMLIEQAAEAFYIWRRCRPETGPLIAEIRHQISHSP